MDESIPAEGKKQVAQKPPLSVGRIAAQILAGTILCIVVFMLFGMSGFPGSAGDIGDLGVLLIFIIFFSPWYMIGSALGVYLVGNIGKQTGSFLAALGSGFLGGLVMFLLFAKELVSLTEEKIVTLGLMLLIGPIMATIGFNLTRRYKRPRSSGGKYFVSYP